MFNGTSGLRKKRERKQDENKEKSFSKTVLLVCHLIGKALFEWQNCVDIFVTFFDGHNIQGNYWNRFDRIQEREQEKNVVKKSLWQHLVCCNSFSVVFNIFSLVFCVGHRRKTSRHFRQSKLMHTHISVLWIGPLKWTRHENELWFLLLILPFYQRLFHISNSSLLFFRITKRIRLDRNVSIRSRVWRK